MSSSFGFQTNKEKSLASGLKVASDNNVLYAPPVGFHLVSTVDTASAVTLTARQVLGGMILQDPAGGAVTTTLPTAAEVVKHMRGSRTNSSVRFIIRNIADAAETITVAAGTGITSASGNTLTVGQNATAEYLLVVTNAVSGSEAATLYTLSSAGTH